MPFPQNLRKVLPLPMLLTLYKAYAVSTAFIGLHGLMRISPGSEPPP